MFNKKDIQNLLGKVVRNERLKNNLTQAELAEASDLDDTYISQIERGLANPSMYTLHKVASVLNLSEYELYLKISQERAKLIDESERSDNEFLILFNAIGNLSASLILTNTEDDDFRILYCNDSFMELVNELKGDIIGTKLFDKLSNDNNQKELKKYFGELKDLPKTTRSLNMVDEKGIVNHFEINSTAVLNDWEGVDKYIFMIRNQVDSENQSDKIEKIVEKYSFLLSESNHRIKNNLAVIIGIIDLELLKYENAEIQNVLHSIQRRISYIAEFHKLLQIDAHDYNISANKLLRSLIASIRKTAGIDGNVETQFLLDEVNLSKTEAVKMGLLLHELITNTQKHAFPGLTRGIIRFELKQNNGIIKVSYLDNGVGFSNGTNKKEGKSNLGMKLIHSLLDELEAKDVQMKTEDGFQLQFILSNNHMSRDH